MTDKNQICINTKKCVKRVTNLLIGSEDKICNPGRKERKPKKGTQKQCYTLSYVTNKPKTEIKNL